MSETENKFIECECAGEGVLITKDSEFELIYLAMFSQGVSYYPKPSIWKRIRFAYNHLVSGKYYEDELVLTYDRANELANHINNITKQQQKDT